MNNLTSYKFTKKQVNKFTNSQIQKILVFKYKL